MRVEVPFSGTGDAAVTAEVLDRAGGRTRLPVATSTREDADRGVRWAVGEVALSPLAPADYALRLIVGRDGRRDESIVAFRLVQ